jgi:hypothetical protein
MALMRLHEFYYRHYASHIPLAVLNLKFPNIIFLKYGNNTLKRLENELLKGIKHTMQIKLFLKAN